MTKTDQQLWLESVVNNLGKALLTTDGEGKVTFLNQEAEALTCGKMAEVVGRPLSEAIQLFSSATQKPVNIAVQKAMSEHKVLQSEQSLFLVNREGNRLYVTYSVSPIKAGDNQSAGTVVVICTHEKHQFMTPKKLTKLDFEKDHEDRSLRNSSFYTKREGQFVRIMIDDVLWIEAMENYAQLVTSEDRYMIHTTMKKLNNRLQPQGFKRVHRSYIVPVDRVDAIEENRLYIGAKEIPIGKSFRQDLLQALTFL